LEILPFIGRYVRKASYFTPKCANISPTFQNDCLLIDNFGGKMLKHAPKFCLVFSGVMLSLMTTLNPVQSQEKKVSFTCQKIPTQNGQEMISTTVALTARGTVPIIRWKTNAFGNYPPQKRCEEVSKRFQEAYDNGSLNYITNGTINQQNVICTALKNKGECHTLLMTLLPEDDSVAIVMDLGDVLNGRPQPLEHTSDAPRLYYKINIERLMETTATIEDIIRGTN
jgi:hypothetical protein